MTETHYLANMLILLAAEIISRFWGAVRDRGKRAA